jgi:hypothetical protein
MIRSAVQLVILFLVATISLAIVVWTVNRADADPGGGATPPGGLRAGDPQPEIMHFNLLGPDWARIPEGYSGVTPEKITAGLNIPNEYIMLHNPFRTNGPLTQNESSIPLGVFYPSMKGAFGYGAAEAPSSESRIYAVLHASREEESRKGVRSLLSGVGTRRSSQLDVDRLCGYVDNEHPGRAGQEFYSSCNESEQTFFIDCFPPYNNRRSCSETSFLEDQFGAELTYQYPMLKDHQALLGALKKLVMSFVQPNTEK